MQISFMLGGTLLFSIFAVSRAGGLDVLHARIAEGFAGGGPTGLTAEETLAFTPGWAKEASLAVLALFGLQWLIQLNADGTGYLAQRSMACRSVRDAKIAAVVFTFTQVLLRSLLWLPLALALLVLYPPDPELPRALLQAEREGTYVRGMADLLPIGVLGLMLTGMFAAFASTVDTHINWGSSYWTNDIYKRFICRGLLHREPDPRTLVWVARGSNLLVIGIALVVMTQLQSIHHAWQTSLLLGAGMGIVLVLRWIWWRMNAWGEIVAIATSAVMAPILLATIDDAATRLLLIGAISTVAALVAVRLRGPEDPRQLAVFYDRAHPPGFWGPVAAARSEAKSSGPRRLRRALAAMFLAGLSCFCLLVGLGSWLVDSPPPAWFPWGTAWQVGLIVVGLGLCPLWLHLGFGSGSRSRGSEDDENVDG
jgi:Na+/proline symporter